MGRLTHPDCPELPKARHSAQIMTLEDYGPIDGQIYEWRRREARMFSLAVDEAQKRAKAQS